MIKQSALTLLLLSTCFAGCSSTQKTDQPPNDLVTQGSTELAWLTGCWTTRATEPTNNATNYVEETWRSAPQGSLLFGTSVTTQEGITTFYELLTIKRKSADWTLSAYPNGVGPTDFTGTITASSSIRFDNKTNDYPQRITYERVGNRLNAEISMADGSRVNRWNYERCSTGS